MSEQNSYRCENINFITTKRLILKSILINLVTRKILIKIFPQNENTISYINKISSESEQRADDLVDLNLDHFKTWTIVNLKAFRHLKGNNSEGGLESLAAKAFCLMR